VNTPEKPYFTEDEAESLARYIHAAAVVAAFCLPVMFSCGIEGFFQTSVNILLKGQGMQVMLILISVFLFVIMFQSQSFSFCGDVVGLRNFGRLSMV
jgi:hypothetical protein